MSAGIGTGKSRLGRSLALPKLFLSVLFVLFGIVSARAESDAARTARLFMWASDGNVRHRDLVGPAKDSLAQMGEKSAPHLARRLSTSDARERLTLAEIFEKMGKVGTPFLIPYLDSAGEDMPKNAARCLERIKDTAAVIPLLAQMDHPEYSVRSQVATALGKTGDSQAMDSLINHLSLDADSDVRKSCAVAIGDCGGQPAFAPLIDALADSSFAVRQSSIAALIKLQVPLPLIRDAAASQELKERALDLRELGRIVVACAVSEPRAEGAIDAYLKSSDPLVRGFAVEGLGLGIPIEHESKVAKLKARETDPFVLAQIARFEQIVLQQQNEQAKSQ